MSDEDVIGPELRGMILQADWIWDEFKIADAIRRGEATRQEVIDHIKKFERENKGKRHVHPTRA